jgi:hypothetical protein
MAFDFSAFRKLLPVGSVAPDLQSTLLETGGAVRSSDSLDFQGIRDWGSTTSTPRWVYVVGIHGLVLLFVILHLTGGGLRGY